MTVSSSTNRVSYSGNGTLTTFAYTFKVFDQGDLTVILRSSTGTETVQTITTHYTVTGVGDVGGGNVVFVTAPSATETVVILREQDLTQGLDLVPNDPFPAQSLEESLDKLTFMVQQHEEELGRAIKASRTNTLTGSEFTISAADRANKVFAFDSSGDLSVTQELGTFKGDWAASTAYVERDLVKDTTTNDVFIVNSAHTSSGSLPLTTNTNSAKYDKIIDISNPPGDLTVGGNISTSGSVTAGNFIIGSADINENDLEAIDSVTAGTVAASKAVVVDVNKDISSFRNLTATGDITFGGLSDGTITVTAFVDEDNMASDSATLVPTQQSVKAYVDAQVATADALSEVLGNGNTTGGTNLVVSSGDTLDVDGALDASGTISLGGNFPTGTDNVALGSSALGAVLSAGERNTIIGSAAGDGITNGDDNTALGAGALGSITTQSSNTAVGRNALTSTTGTANTALGNGAGSQITSGQYNTVLGLFNGNQNSLDIRTSSNNVVLSDGQGNVRFYANSSGNVGLGSVSPDAELHISSSSSTPKIIIENSTNPRGNFIGSANNGDLVLGADEDSLSGSSAIRFKVDGTEVMSLDYQGTLGLTGNATFGDNDKAIFGAGSDLQIYHNTAGFTGNIIASATNNLYIRSNSLYFQKADGTENNMFAISDGAVSLAYDNNVKLATTSTGVDITGTLTSDGLTVDGTGTAVTLQSNNSGGPLNILQFKDTDTSLANTQSTGNIEWYTSDADSAGVHAYIKTLGYTNSPADMIFGTGLGGSAALRMKLGFQGDISFYEDTGTTAKFFWDASAESLGIGAAPSTHTLEVWRSGGDHLLLGRGGVGTYELGVSSNNALTFEDGGSERMRIDSSGNVGIGVTSIQASAAGKTLETSGCLISGGTLNSHQTNRAVIEYNVGSNAMNIRAYGATAGSGIMTFATGGGGGSADSEAMRIDSSGNVGIGTSSPINNSGYGGLTLNGANGSILSMKDSDTEVSRFVGSATETSIQYGTSSVLTFRDGLSGGTERMRIDSSGNLLVSATTTSGFQSSSSESGTIAYAAGGIASNSPSNDVAGVFNRLGNAGAIVQLKDDGTTVGQLLTGSGGYMHIIGGNNTFGSGIALNNQTWNPTNASGTITDNHVKLGDTSSRFTDLYLSGGVYLGGTGSANKLDDYEQGTFQATLSAPTSGTITISSTADTLAYVKVGRLVTITGMVSIVSTGSAVGDFVLLNNLPFTSADRDEFSGRNGGAATFNDSSAGTKTTKAILMLESSTQIRIYVDASTVAGSDDFYLSFSYQATA